MLQDKLRRLGGQLDLSAPGVYLPSLSELRAYFASGEDGGAEILKQGKDALKEGIRPLPATLYMEFRREGNRQNYESIYYGRRISLARMVKAFCCGDESPALLDGITDMMSAICDEWTWVIPAHNWPNDESGKALPPVDPPRVDLMAANTASMLALSVYYLGDALREEAGRLLERIKRECRRRCIEPFMENNEHWWMGYRDFEEHGELNNWTPWITDNFLHCLLCLKPGTDEWKNAVNRAGEILNHYLDVLPSDGGCDEGAIYWDHAVGSLFGCLDILEYLSKGRMNLLDDPFLKKAASYIHRVHIDGAYFANFADCPGILDHMPAGLMFRMGTLLRDRELKSLAFRLERIAKSKYSGKAALEEAFSFHRNFRNVFFPMEGGDSPQSRESEQDYFPETEVYVRKSENLFFACKGGHNGESHNHNDIGQFLFYWKNQPLIIDPGVGEYRRETFNHLRYTIWTMCSGWHNLPLVNGTEQKDGSVFRSSAFDVNDGGCSVGIESAYPREAMIKSWKRDFRFRDYELLLKDSWQMEVERNAIDWHFICLDEPSLNDGQIEIPLTRGNGILRYPADSLDAGFDFQDIPENDTKMGVWGRSRIWRIKLSYRGSAPSSGSIDFIMTGE